MVRKTTIGNHRQRQLGACGRSRWRHIPRMYLDLPACDNLPEPTMATFKETGPAVVLQAIKLWRDQTWQWCAVTGWSETGPVLAMIQPIEESGDGPARLIHGGEHGLRLALLPTSGAVRWSVDNAEQWGEPFLIVRPDPLEYR